MEKETSSVHGVMNDEEVIRKMLKTKAQNRNRYVEELGYSVDSGWEKEIGFILEDCGVDYERGPIFDMETWEKYSPDFISGRFVIEVKGYYKMPKKAKEFMELHDEYFYVVIGEYQPCHIFIEWDDREELKNLLRYR